jgi:hypothetical protein
VLSGLITTGSGRSETVKGADLEPWSQALVVDTLPETLKGAVLAQAIPVYPEAS